jgi:hypothetical protein
MIAVIPSDAAELDSLLDPGGYTDFLKTASH